MKPLTCTCGSHTWTTSPGPTSPSACEVLVSIASAEPWLCTTPFGLPVEPEVEKTTAGWSGAGAGGGGEAPGGVVGRGRGQPPRRIAREQRGERLVPVGVAGDQHAHARQ